jgi:hypothetical protein
MIEDLENLKSFDIYKLNRFGCNIVPADRMLIGKVHPEAAKYCGPFLHANGAGWWVYPPIDMDLTYGNGEWKFKILSDYPDDEVGTLAECAEKFGSKSLRKEGNQWLMGQHSLAKSKYSFGQVEKDVFQFWTGCVFKLPKDWALLITDPINIGLDRPFRVQNGIVEVDWLRVDHWINFKWTRPFEWYKLRKDNPEPIAQIIPVHKDSYDMQKWMVSKGRTFISDEKAFKEWDEYYYNKFTRLNSKDSTTYHKTRKKIKNEIST